MPIGNYINPYDWKYYGGLLCEASDGGYYQEQSFGWYPWGRYATPVECPEPYPCDNGYDCKEQNASSQASSDGGFYDYGWG